jgi:voltage-gated potassium channel Kch
VLINAIDDPQASLQLVELAKEHFPHLQIISRARASTICWLKRRNRSARSRAS